MTLAADVQPVRSTAAGGLAGLGLVGWLGTMSPHTARAYQVDLRQFTEWLAAQQIPPDRVTPGVTTSWLADLAAAGQQVDPRAAHRLLGRARRPRRHRRAASAHPAAYLRHQRRRRRRRRLKVATALGHASPSTTMRYVRGRDVITRGPVHTVAIING